MAVWADAVLLAGDFGRNSETAILLESVLEKHRGQITINQDALDYFIKQPELALNREDTCIVATFEQLQKIAASTGSTTALTSSMDLLHFIEGIHQLSQKSAAHIITKFQDTMVVASQGDVTTTKLSHDKKTWRVETAANASVWWLQNPNNAMAALTTSLIA
jgi:NAD(P)H-hydrate repair Nnr-like enzyme with NAD(P)H-hydrate dehydratase domain